jgi:hypothetical protein
LHPQSPYGNMYPMHQQQQQQQNLPQQPQSHAHSSSSTALHHLMSMRSELAQLQQQRQARHASFDIAALPHVPYPHPPLGTPLPPSLQQHSPHSPLEPPPAAQLSPTFLTQASALDDQLQPRMASPPHASGMPWQQEGNLALHHSTSSCLTTSPSAASRMHQQQQLPQQTSFAHVQPPASGLVLNVPGREATSRGVSLRAAHAYQHTNTHLGTNTHARAHMHMFSYNQWFMSAVTGKRVIFCRVEG